MRLEGKVLHTTFWLPVGLGGLQWAMRSRSSAGAAQSETPVPLARGSSQNATCNNQAKLSLNGQKTAPAWYRPGDAAGDTPDPWIQAWLKRGGGQRPGSTWAERCHGQHVYHRAKWPGRLAVLAKGPQAQTLLSAVVSPVLYRVEVFTQITSPVVVTRPISSCWSCLILEIHYPA